MGGIPIKPFTCRDYTTAASIDKDFETYVMAGLMLEAEEMTKYSWFSFLMYLWNVDTQEYMTTLETVLDCGMTNKVVGSKFANEEYMKGTFDVVKRKYEEIYEILDLWWHPMMVLFFAIIPLGDLGYLIASIVMMFDYQEVANGLNK